MSKPASTLSPKRDAYCSYCGQGFKRDEHLERHILTHTNVRPFRCPECGVAFKRKDLLRRHYKAIHVQPPDKDDPIFLRTAVVDRIPIACLNCAQSKTKCDKQVPCGRCVKRNLTCQKRQFRRNNWKGNPDVATTTASSPNDKITKEESVEERHEIETPIVSDVPLDPSQQPWALQPPSSGSEVDMDMRMPPMTVPTSVPWMNQPGSAMTDVELEQSHTFPFPPSSGVNSAIPPNTPNGPHGSVQFDSPMGEETFDKALADMYLSSASSEAGFSELDWSLVHQELLSLTGMPPEPISNDVLPLHQDWPLFDCNPATSNSVAPRTRENIAELEVLDDPNTWSSCARSSYVEFQRSLNEKCWTMQPIDQFVRDRWLAVTQYVWRLSKERIFPGLRNDRQSTKAFPWMDRVILLPQTDALTSLLTKYTLEADDQFHLFPHQKPLTPQELLPQSDNRLLSGTLILLKIAQAIRSDSSPQARGICNAFVEVCSALVDDAVQVKDEVSETAKSIELSVGLLQLLLWSGDPWHMTIVPDIWSNHTKIVQKAISAENARKTPLQMENLWPGESLSRMLHSWVSVDLEMSLFNDVPPKLDAASITIPLPLMALAPQEPHMNAEGWQSETSPVSTVENTPSSLASLFEAFMEGQLCNLQDITATHLRLLLHPLQSLSMRLHQCLDTFGNLHSPGTRPSNTISLASKAFADENRILLARWRHLATIIASRSATPPRTLASSLALYYIMVINSLASFPEVERLVRLRTGGTISQNHSYQSWMRNASLEGLALLMFSCGQGLNVLRSMSPMERPLWWPAALYRVTLVFCQAIIAFNSISAEGASSDNPSVVVLDRDFSPNAEDHDPSLQKFLSKLQGRPVLTGADGNVVLLLDEATGFDHCIAILEQHLSFDKSAFAQGVYERLCQSRSRRQGKL
ncbi:hypothetical protein EJ04DRAFT_564970 [Polyplosphaeria fusca]|uniref:Uncharacterized protein n=1 Tax=Polyplosphaeria fusca TaxID=682080 RepID=A0A9P4QTG9_9PLEO|nr:hypothetical protein EJ04DRAFT_564970 [Polyplosphaeria fusca]